MWLYDKKLVNRVSLRLSGIISFVDILSGAMLVFLHRKKVTVFSDRWYIPVAFFTAFIINIPPLIYNQFGFDGHSCLYRDPFGDKTQIWKLATFIIPVSFSMIYCTLVLAIVIMKLIFEHRKLADAVQTKKTNNTTLNAKTKRQKLLLLKLVSRISLYAAIPLVNISGIVVEYTWLFIHRSATIPPPVSYWAVIGSCLPAIHNALKKVKRDLIDNYGYERHGISLSSPPSSPSFPPTPTSPFFMPPSSPTFLNNSNPNSPLYGSNPTSPRTPGMRILIPPYSPNRSGHSPLQSTFSPLRSRFDPNTTRNKMNQNRPILRWFVRTFLDKQKLPVFPNGLSESSGSDRGHAYSSATANSGILSGQSYGQNYRNGETRRFMYDMYNNASDKRKKTFMKRISRVLITPTEESFNELDFSITASTETVPKRFKDIPRVVYEHNYDSSGSFLFPPVAGNTTINIHVHQYPSNTIIEAGPSRYISHRRSDSNDSTLSRDSIDNELSAY
ncbi:11869_t:CDS:2 [Scutellospora calospora]|uniref:11869_t:CDS:1 n=1 Tax=Scutellospora calospora TaxID=85575 RepID=A0ACA9KWW8_9GLOM|nr:11869_t:CDS:2 [Scutellospora calospora]